MKDMQNYFRQNSKGSETEKGGKSLANWRDKKKTSVTRKKAMEKQQWKSGKLGHAGSLGQGKLLGFIVNAMERSLKCFKTREMTMLLSYYCL